MAETTTKETKETTEQKEREIKENKIDPELPRELPGLIEILYNKDTKVLKIKIVRSRLEILEKPPIVEEANLITTYKNVNKIREMCISIENTPIFDTAFNIILNTLKINPEELKFNKINEPPKPLFNITLKNYIYQYKMLPIPQRYA